MIRYLLEFLVFQLVFLLVYDLFLKRETFFQWNRVYLIGTYILSLVLPWITIEAFKTTVPEGFSNYTQFVFQLDEVQLGTTDSEAAFLSLEEWGYLIFFMGALFTTFWFGYKLLRLYRLWKKGVVSHHTKYTEVVVAKSELAFSFFRYIFLGAKVSKENVPNIIAHELVHIDQKHSLDLLFFESMRIISWFNPLVYLYQNRISELHEFIADSEVSKHNKKEHYQILLSEVFQTQNISFVNQFFKKSLIKKRIVMLQKEKSKRIYQLKYLFLLPITIGILFYTSCKLENDEENGIEDPISLDEMTIVGYSYDEDNSRYTIDVDDLNSLTTEEKEKREKLLSDLADSKSNATIKVVDEKGNFILIQIEEGSISSVNVNKVDGQNQKLNENNKISFAEIDEVPIFRGCEGATDTRLCFMEKIQAHIKKYFYYPEEAQNKGIEGRVNVIFTITEEGFVEDIRTRGPDKILEDVVVDIISKLPRMQPGKYKGKNVSVPFSIPVTFKLQ